jgi:hypothetical protein
MATFQPPRRTTVPAVGPDTPSWQRKPAIWNVSGLIPRHANVWKLLDGTYTETQPYDLTTVAVTYYGGHVYSVSSSEAAALTAAGYAADIS